MDELMVINSNGRIFWHGNGDVDAEIELDNAEEKFPGENWEIKPADENIEIVQLRSWSCFNEQEQANFSERFYELWKDAGFGEPDYDSPNPWGCPWYWYSGEICSPEELFDAYKDEIAELQAEEEAADAASEAFREELERMYREGGMNK